MKKILFIIAIFSVLGLSSDFNVTTERIIITNGTDVLEMYLESDTAYIYSSVPLLFDVPNLINIQEQLDDMQKQIDDLSDAGFRNGLYWISDSITE